MKAISHLSYSRIDYAFHHGKIDFFLLELDNIKQVSEKGITEGVYTLLERFLGTFN